MAKKKGFITALYERLSRDDEQFGDSVSILNQKTMLENYAKEHGYENIRHYTDDGYSGGSFERPGWKKMIEDIEAGEIATVIAKDMSRIGRNYLEVGYYTEVYFGQKDIRFIAVSNNVDSSNQCSAEFAPFLNIMNEWYLKDCSNKIKASKRSLGNSGVHLSVQPVYGYRKHPEDKHRWIVDEEAAEVVRLIYKLCIEGNGTTQIARILCERRIETPAYHAAKNGEGRFRYKIDELDPYKWNSGTVKAILSRPEYLGCTVNFKTESKSYKEKKNIINSPDKWAVFENTQEPIIDAYNYQLAQKLIKTRRRVDTLGETNPLTGLVFCADCGSKMYNHRAKPQVDRQGKRQSGFDSYNCSAYKLSTKGTSSEVKCSSHHISTKALQEIILYTIKNVCRYAIEDKDAFIKKVKDQVKAKSTCTDKGGKRRYESNKKRLQELDKIFKNLYESFALGIITEDRFKMLSESYEEEQAQIKEQVQRYEEMQVEQERTDSDIESFYSLVERYTSFEELTPAMLNEFVDKVLVHRAEKIDGRRTQKVEVYLNFIGMIDFPEPEKTPEELEQEKIDEYWREKYRRTRDYELARRKKITKKKLAILDAEEKKERERMIREFDETVEAEGLESMPLIPQRLSKETTPDTATA